MNREETGAEQSGQAWFIDLEWLRQNNRSFTALARDCLCTSCSKRLGKKWEKISDAELLATIQGCCASTPEFITSELPILESIFHFFLANGNEPLDLEHLSQQLRERRGGDSQRTAPEILSRLLKTDRYYGLRPAQTRRASKQEKPRRRASTSP